MIQFFPWVLAGMLAMRYWRWLAAFAIMGAMIANTLFWICWFQFAATLGYLAESQRKLGPWLRP